MKSISWILLFIFLLMAAPVQAGNSAVAVRTVYSSTNVTTSDWRELIASTTTYITTAVIFDSSGQTMELGIGASGSEVRQILIPPGGAVFKLALSMGTRIAIRAVSNTASVGENDATFSY